MKNLKTLLAGSAALATIAFASVPAQAYDLSIESLNTNTDFVDPDASLFDVDFNVTGTGVTFSFANNDDQYGSTITSIFFGEVPNFGNIFDLTTFSPSNGSGVSYKDTLSSGGPASLGFTVESEADRTNAGGVSNGINYDETLNISFGWAGEAKTESEIASLFNSGDLALGFHLQTINGSGSEFYGTSTSTSKVPEPMGLLGMVGVGLGVAMRRRK